MALSGMEIFKLLPRTNCRECGSPTCLAFAMKMAAGKALMDQCPHLSAESGATLLSLMEPPIREIIIKRGDKSIKIGNEKVMFRHDEAFYNPTALGILLKREENPEDRIRAIENLHFERAGEAISIDLLCLEDDNSPDFKEFASSVYHKTTLPIVVKTDNFLTISELSEIIPHEESVYYFTEHVNGEQTEFLRLKNITVAQPCRSLQECRSTGEKYSQTGIRNGIFAVEAVNPKQELDILTSVRNGALTAGDKALGYPVLLWNKGLTGLTNAILKYGSMAVTDCQEPDMILTYLTLRQNIFTDPRRPIQVEAKLYSFGDVIPQSPVLVTTNFSLTYFTVAQEIETIGIPAYLLIVDTDGTSVLTAWAGDKFDGKRILKAIESSSLEQKVSHRNIIIPGYVSELKDEIEEISSWKAITGPGEASDIPGFMRELKF